MDRWRGRVALVTGASAGIGAALCRALVREGMTVVGCARRAERIQAIAEEETLRGAPGQLVAIRCDLRRESEIESLFAEIRQRVGRLDVCINNAGLGHDASLLRGGAEEFRSMLDVNVMALCICTQQAVKLMQEKGIDDGQIIHISSQDAHEVPGTDRFENMFYGGTKFMVRALTEGLRRELKAAGSRIRVGSISPNFVETEYFSNFSQVSAAETRDFFRSFSALRPEDIAESVLHVLAAPPHVEVHDVLIKNPERV